MRWSFGTLLLVVLLSCIALEGTVQTALPPATLIPTQTSVPANTAAPASIPNDTVISTLLPTLTPVPQDSILFQRDFEDGFIGDWAPVEGVWTLEQEPDGNHCLAGSAHSATPPQIWRHDRTLSWTDYALETRFKFIKGHTLFILIHSIAGSDEYYGVAINEYGYGFMKTWVQLGNNIPMSVYPDKWYTIRVEIQGDSLRAYVDSDALDSRLSQEISLPAPILERGGFGYVIGEEDQVCFDDIKVWSLK